jgi:RNA polymerase sigma-70 factor, ECF subfamily
MITIAPSIPSLPKWKDLNDFVPVLLIQEIARGNEQALGQLYDLTKHLVYNLAFKMLGNHPAAEETVLDVYLQIWKQAALYSEVRGLPLVWLITITRSRALDRLRHEKRQRRISEPLETVTNWRANTENPELASIFAERRHQVQTALAQLTPAQREVLTLAFYFGMTQTEIADHLGHPLGTIKTRTRYGLLHLKRTLGLGSSG